MPPYDGDLPGAGASGRSSGLRITGIITREEFRARYLYNACFWRGEYIGKFQRWKTAFLLLKNIDFLAENKSGRRLAGFDGWCYAGKTALANHEDLKTDRGNVLRLLEVLTTQGLLITAPFAGPSGTNLRKASAKGKAWLRGGGWPMYYRVQNTPGGSAKDNKPENILHDQGAQKTPQDPNNFSNNASESYAPVARGADKSARPNPSQTTKARNIPAKTHSPEPAQQSAPVDYLAAISSVPFLELRSRKEFAAAYLGTEDGVHWFDADAVTEFRQHRIRTKYAHLQIDFKPGETQSAPVVESSELQQDNPTAEEGEVPSGEDAARAENYAANDLLLAGLNDFIAGKRTVPSLPESQVEVQETPESDRVASPDSAFAKVIDPVIPTHAAEPATDMDPETTALAYRALQQCGLSPSKRGQNFARPVTLAECQATLRGERDHRKGRAGYWHGPPPDERHSPRLSRRKTRQRVTVC